MRPFLPAFVVALALAGCNAVPDMFAPHESSYAFGPEPGLPDFTGLYARQQEVTDVEGGTVVAVYADTLRVTSPAPGRLVWERRSSGPGGGSTREMTLARVGDVVLASSPLELHHSLGVEDTPYTYSILALSPAGELSVQAFIGASSRGKTEAETRAGFERRLRAGDGRNGPAHVYARVR